MMPKNTDTRSWGLVLLRIGVGASLAAIYGWPKAAGLAAVLGSGHGIADWGFTHFLAAMGFPLPVLFAICALLNETLAATAVACGLLTRWSAVIVATGMAIALDVSLRLHEEPLRAALYVFLFATVAVAAPREFSLGALLRNRAPFNGPPAPDAALLVLRLGLAAAFLLALALPPHPPLLPGGAMQAALALLLAAISLLAALGACTRPAALAGCALWLVSLSAGLAHGVPLSLVPARSLLFMIGFAALAVAGPGRFSLSARRRTAPASAPATVRDSS